jgi:hypothetical protein
MPCSLCYPVAVPEWRNWQTQNRPNIAIAVDSSGFRIQLRAESIGKSSADTRWHRRAHFSFLDVPHFTSLYFALNTQNPA